MTGRLWAGAGGGRFGDYGFFFHLVHAAINLRPVETLGLQNRAIDSGHHVMVEKARAVGVGPFGQTQQGAVAEILGTVKLVAVEVEFRLLAQAMAKAFSMSWPASSVFCEAWRQDARLVRK